MSNLAGLVEKFERTLWLPDPSIVYATLGAVAANRLDGDPFWLMIVGASSSGKTVVLDSLSDLSEYHMASTITEAGLLSGATSRDPNATGGLLDEVGERGLIVAPDFGTLLSEHAATRNRIFACLREVFDGKLVRRLGTNGGVPRAWMGHAGFLGAVTQAIDSPNLNLGLLGERFSYFRMPASTPNDEYLACVVADEHAGHQQQIRAGRSAAVAAFFADLAPPDELPAELPALSEPERDRLVTLATIGARCRSPVERDWRTREIEMVPDHERATRLFGQLRQFHAGLVVIGTPPSIYWPLLAKVALDGIHPGRRAVMDYLIEVGGAHSTSSIAGHCRFTETPTRRHLQDLHAHGALDRVNAAPELWAPSEWLREQWWAVSDAAPTLDSLGDQR